MKTAARLFSALALVATLAALPVKVQAELVRFHEVVPGKLYRGGQPETPEDFETLRKQGIRTIINLKTTDDEIEWEGETARHFGITMISRQTGSFFSPSDEHVNEIQEMLIDPTLQPVYIHCRHGKDRTGLMVGIYRVEQQGWTPNDAYAEMRAIGFNPWLLGLRSYFWERMEYRFGRSFQLRFSN